MRQTQEKMSAEELMSKAYQDYAGHKLDLFSEVQFIHIPRSFNILVDSLTSFPFALSFILGWNQETVII